MSRREYIFEDGDIVNHPRPLTDPKLKLIIPTNVEIENYGILRVGGLQVHGYEFDMSCTIDGCMTLPQGRLTENFWFEIIKEFESLTFLMGSYQNNQDWF